MFRIYMMYDGVCQTTLRGEFYKAMINSSMICWMDVDSGHLEFRDLRMPYRQVEIIDVKYCRIELDHEVNTVV